jgi:hypothetical protein
MTGLFVCLFGVWTGFHSLTDSSPEYLSTYRMTTVGLTGASLKAKQGQWVQFYIHCEVQGVKESNGLTGPQPCISQTEVVLDRKLS